jgi:hypothetical protein
MKRTLLVVLGLALCASAASAQPYDCRKAKAASFTASTADVNTAFASQVGVAFKKPFLYCQEAGINAAPAGNTRKVCYKVKGTNATDQSISATDVFGTVALTVKKKSFVVCVPST